MRLPRPRFTIRLLLIVVAIVAVLLAGGIGATRLVRRSRHFRQLAVSHANEERLLPRLVAKKVAILGMAETFAERHSRKEYEGYLKADIRFMEYLRLLIAYHARMKQKYERAASHPWEFVPPDPPAPTFPPAPPEPADEPDTAPAQPRKRIEHWPILTAIPTDPIESLSCAPVAQLQSPFTRHG